MASQQARRRRFGVSIPADLAASLDTLAKLLGKDRSSLITEALRTFIHDYVHLAKPHYCRGVIIVWSKEGETSKLREIVEEYMDVVRGHMHTHLDEYCIDLLVVAGESDRITSLARSILSLPGCTARYIPLSVLQLSGEREAYRGGEREAPRS
ncbi:putative transcriptional regulator, CopG family [Pyrolobus fumarii 1A]|uniref:Putative transcriptional regulator, CopG family n=1 Tax=Pyrolobus fumarii (strain DSM 11204 / 1A) TaxID=694429 RepID=G0EDH9_PYRF1|nr:CopG family ribbon-helix-helix protein [Pyrolobus fumarii]AEM38664.1 putative transcriptional regulator, CopG family [Pyrolobus fumarii 1A]